MILDQYSYFTPNKQYYKGNRVALVSEDISSVCVWECVVNEYKSSIFKAYSYTPTRTKSYHWRKICCEPYSLNLEPPIDYGVCSANIPRKSNAYEIFTNLIEPHLQVIDEDYYENGIFI